MGLKLVTAPGNDPITLDEAKAHLRVDFTDDDDMIAAFVSASTGFVDGPKGFLGRALIDQTWDLYLDRFPNYLGRYHSYHRSSHVLSIEVPLPPLIEVLGVFYIDGSGTEQTVDDTTYIVDDTEEPARIVPKGSACWPMAACQVNAVRIRFRAGYIDATNSPATDNVPNTIKAAIKLHVGDLYANRETMVVGARAAAVVLPWSAESLLRPHRVILSLA